MKNLSDLILKPKFSEKSFEEAKADRYTFVVNRFATKTDIKNAVEKLFGVNVKRVYTAIIKGSKTRSTRYGRRIFDASYKKARVQIEKGQKIDIFEEDTKDAKKSK